MVDVNRYTEGVQAEVDKVRQLMQDTWGYAPEVTVKVETVVRISADFNMKGFAHDGRFIMVHDGNTHRRTPEKVAKEIMGEITSHKNTCAECGDTSVGVLYHRAYEAERIAGLSKYPSYYQGQNGHQRDSEDSPYYRTQVRGQHNPETGVWEYLPAERVYITVPADAVEMYLEPGRARRLNKAIAVINKRDEAARIAREAEEAEKRIPELTFSGC